MYLKDLSKTEADIIRKKKKQLRKVLNTAKDLFEAINIAENYLNSKQTFTFKGCDKVMEINITDEY